MWHCWTNQKAFYFENTWECAEVSPFIFLLFLFLLILMRWWPSHVSGVVPLQREGVDAHRRLPPWTIQRRAEQVSGRGWKTRLAPPQPRATNQLQARLQGNSEVRDVWFLFDHLGYRMNSNTNGFSYGCPNVLAWGPKMSSCNRGHKIFCPFNCNNRIYFILSLNK